MAAKRLGDSPAQGHPYALYLDERLVRGLMATLPLGDAGGPAPDHDVDPGHALLFRFLRAAAAAEALHDPEDQALAVGDLVDLSGVSGGNPLLPVLDFVATVLPLVSDPTPGRPRPARGTPATRPPADVDDAQVQRVLAGMVVAARDGLRDQPGLDVVVALGSGLRAVLTLDRALLGSAGPGQLVGRHVRVVGKVTAVLGEGQVVNLFRRTALGASSPQTSRDMIAELAEGGLDIELADPVIEGPAIEVLPAAILL